jgi:hypothetical protein
MKPAQKVVSAVLAAALLIGGSTLLLSLPAAPQAQWIVHGHLAVSLALAVAYVGAVVLYLMSLKVYKAETRRAFIVICFGMICIALGAAQLALLTSLSLLETSYAKTGAVAVPFLLSGLVLYIGVRRFARLVGISSILTRISLVLPAILALSVLAIFLPHTGGHYASELEIDASNGILVWTAFLDLTAALLILKVKAQIGSHYANAMAWLFVMLMWSGILSLIAIADTLVTQSGQDVFSLTVQVLALVDAGFALWAGYAFTKTEDY